jgi:phosphoglycolate phosphatase-like HAD superfamily hydrolase
MPEPGTGAALDYLTPFVAILFDLDGVIVDANLIKVDCMRTALADLDPAATEPFLTEFRRTFGRTRLEHFAALHGEFLDRRSGFEDFYREYAGRYAALLSAAYPRAPLCAHAAELLAVLGERGTPLYVVTGTPSTEAEQVLRAHGLRDRFRAVFGGEGRKADRIGEILRQTGLAPGEAVLAGDARQDFSAAQEHGIPFLFVARYSLCTLAEMTTHAAGVPFGNVYDLSLSRAGLSVTEGIR